MVRKRPTLSRLLLAIALCSSAVGFGITIGSPAEAAGTSYYVNNASGSGCSNAGSGTSSSSPWCDFTNVNARSFNAGDSILLASGDTWNQELDLGSSGTAGSPITITSYGTGARPIISRNGATTDRAVYLANPSYVTVSQLEVSHAAVGIEAHYTTLSHAGLAITDIYAHNIAGIAEANSTTYQPTCSTSPIPDVYTSAGVVVTGPATLVNGYPTFPFTSSQYALNGATLARIEVSHSSMGVEIAWCNGVRSSDNTDGSNLVQNATLDGLYIHDLDGGGATGAQCPNGITMVNTSSGSVIRDSIIENAGACNAQNGTAGILLSRNDGLTVANNIISDTPNVGTAQDQMGIDLEYANTNLVIVDNDIEANYGPGISVLAIRNPTTCPNDSSDQYDHSTNTFIASNLFVNNGGSSTNNGAIHRVSQCFVPTGTLRDNLYSQASNGFATNSSNEDYSGFQFYNNRDVSGASTGQSARDFSSTQGMNNWSYRYWTGSTWSNMPYVTSANSYAFSGAAISAFTMTASSTATTVQRAWAAPSNGTLSGRGRVYLLSGTSATVSMTLNGTTIGSAQTVTATNNGVELQFDNVPVTSGQVVGFVLTSTSGAAISWTPSVAFTHGAPALDQVNTYGTFYQYADIQGSSQRLQTFTPTGSDSSVNVYVEKKGSPSGALIVSLYALNASNQPTTLISQTTVAAGSVTTAASPVSLSTTGLTGGSLYGIVLSSPSTPADGNVNAFGMAYNDNSTYTGGVELYSSNGGTNFFTDGSGRSLEFASFTNG